MILDRRALAAAAEANGFGLEPLEKAVQLLSLTDALYRHPYLGSRLALKGGTALNLFVLDLPRLSVDIDLNYIGAVDRSTMLAERPKVEHAIRAVCGRLGLQVRRVPQDHAGGKWRLSFTNAAGGPGTLELDINFLLRTPLWPPRKMTSATVAGVRAEAVPVLDFHELAAGKLAALFDRAAARDLFDTRSLLGSPGLDHERLRVALVVYGGISRRDWRTVSIDTLRADAGEIERLLLPVLRADVAPPRREVSAWAQRLEADCRSLVGHLLPLRANEVEFLERLNQRGEIAGELVTSDHRVRAIIQAHPGLLWKARNVRQHRGLEPLEEEDG